MRRSTRWTLLALAVIILALGAFLLEPNVQPIWAFVLPAAAILVTLQAISVAQREMDDLLEEGDRDQA